MMPASATMKWASATTSQADTAAAAAETGEALQRALAGETPDLVLAFYGAPHVPQTEALASALRDRLRPGCLAGVSAHGVIGTEHELEAGPVLTVLAARLPDVRVHPFLMLQDSWAGAADDAMEFARCAPHVADAELVVVWADPFSFDIEGALGAFNRHASGVRVVGGMASAGPRPGANTLFLNDWIAHEGGVGLALSGALRADVALHFARELSWAAVGRRALDIYAEVRARKLRS